MVTVDLREADVTADLATAAGRSAAVAGVRAQTDVVHGVVPAAGIAGLTGTDPALVVSVNFFGATALVEGLRDLMAASDGAAVVFVASNSITGQPGWAGQVAIECLPRRRGLGSRRCGAARGGHGLPGHQGGTGLVGPA